MPEPRWSSTPLIPASLPIEATPTRPLDVQPWTSTAPAFGDHALLFVRCRLTQ